MLKTPIKILTLAGAMAALLTGTAMAQSAGVVETDGNVAVVPEAALTTQSSIGTVSDNHLPILEQLDNDQAVIEGLLSQGFTDIHIIRKGALMTVTAQRDGQPTELVYSVANGSLVSVDGVELRPEPEASGGEGTTTLSTDAASPDDQAGETPGEGEAEATDDAATEGDAADTSETEGSEDGAAEGAEGEASGEAEGGSDGGAEGDSTN